LKKNNRNVKLITSGFTLVELLAVIIILAVIALIATPIVLNVVENSRKSAFESSIYGIIETIKLETADKMIKEESLISEYNFPTEELEVGGEQPEGGIAKTDRKGKVSIAVHNGKWCGIKGYDEGIVTIKDYIEGDCKVDFLQAPTISLNEDTLHITSDDNRIESYDIYVNGNLKTSISANETIDFDLTTLNLEGGSYQIIVKAVADGYDISDASNEVTYENDGSGGSGGDTADNYLKLGNVRCDTTDYPKNFSNNSKWQVKTWKGSTPTFGTHIWSDGTNIYYSHTDGQYVLNGDTWEAKSWNGFTPTSGSYIWTDGTNIYYSNTNGQYVLNGDTWEAKTWNGSKPVYGEHIWSDGTNIYYSHTNGQYVLNGDTWEAKTWNGLNIKVGNQVWTDGTNIYYSNTDGQYVLNGDTWEAKTWNVAPTQGNKIWTDGTNIYYSRDSNQYVLNDDTWEAKIWTGLTAFYGSNIWSDGTNIYFFDQSRQYVLK